MSEDSKGKQHSHYVAPLLGHFSNDSRYTSPAYVDSTGNFNPSCKHAHIIQIPLSGLSCIYRKNVGLHDRILFLLILL